MVDKDKDDLISFTDVSHLIDILFVLSFQKL